MSENNPSDTTPSQAPVETPAAPAAAPVSIDGFGSSRGTGLARGKRPARPASQAASASAPAAYQPTAVQVIVAKTEYVNPFAPAPEITPAQPAVEAAAPAEVPAAAYVAPAPAPVATPVTAVAPAATAPAPVSSEPKAELNILPPAAPRPTTSWESPGSGAAATPAGDRPVFRPERKPVVTRDIAPLRPQEPRSGEQPRRENREPRREGGEFRREERRESARPLPSPAPATAPAKPEKSGGFLGWLKGIFGGSSAEAPAPGDEITRDGRGPRPEGNGRREGGRHRGGRGRGGPRPEGFQGGENRGPRPEGEQGNGGRRRRRRGGRGRGGPRPEGESRPSGPVG